MKFCTHCGKELFDEAVICPSCGCAADRAKNSPDKMQMVSKLSDKVKTNGIIWLVIGILQVFMGLFVDWFILIVGVLNIVSAVQDMNYSKTVLQEPAGIISKFEPVVMPIVTLIYNLIFGGIIGVAGSIYYFVGIRNFVMENREAFAD